MASAKAARGPEAQKGTAVGPVRLVEASECPVTQDQCLASAHEACQTQGEAECPTGPTSEPELQEERLKTEAKAPDERSHRSLASIVRPSHGLKRKLTNSSGFLSMAFVCGPPPHPRAEAELPLHKETPEGSQSEPSAKQHKKAKKRKSLGAPALPDAVSTGSAPSEILGLQRKAQRLRALYQYINYCNPELNQAGEGHREADTEPESELVLVSEEVGVEQLQALLPVAGEVGSGFSVPCHKTLVPPTHILAPLAEEAAEDPRGLPSLGVSGQIKAEVDKSTQVDIDKMLSVCAAPLVPPLSPQYK
ncbi:PREDICTED: uncharacterized protein C16orf86 homolog [Chrysochloris asiatica]|uniref:Uncharacterized protein C16orf86 homolog n=1 Tax=Chrysochloris asiatica TaxID=185453 RepID=A0A9B0TAU4_CHRAS|nr:PREDICTED: uncharacterized protein C16orf86 homolog [Chrysochloris asiatica]